VCSASPPISELALISELAPISELALISELAPISELALTRGLPQGSTEPRATSGLDRTAP